MSHNWFEYGVHSWFYYGVLSEGGIAPLKYIHQCRHCKTKVYGLTPEWPETKHDNECNETLMAQVLAL